MGVLSGFCELHREGDQGMNVTECDGCGKTRPVEPHDQWGKLQLFRPRVSGLLWDLCPSCFDMFYNGLMGTKKVSDEIRTDG